MSRRSIKKRILSGILTAAMTAALLPAGLFTGPVTVSAAPADIPAEAVSSGERKIKINDDWRFCLLDKARVINNSLDSTASQPDYEESGEWNTVQLPHDWSIYQQFSDSEARAAQGSLAGGTGWYRKSFTLSDDMKDKNIVLQFDAVQMVSEVWINGHNLGKQFLGYVTFEYDITKYLKYNGEENVIAVKAYSSKNSARWYAGAGIYGSVYLIATDKVHVPVNGVHVATVVNENGKWMQPDFHTEPDMDALKKKSTVNVRTNVTNKTASDAEVTVKSTIYSKTNPNVASKQDTLMIPAPASGEEENTERVDQIIEIANPSLWSPDEPNLYWVKTEILQGGNVIDTMDTRFGIRYLYLKPGTYDAPYSEANTIGGLYVNGIYTRINGVCEHRDMGALGMETYQAAIDRRIRKLKDMGVNVVRCAHDPVSPEYIEAADRLGMLIFEEGFDQWLKAKNDDDYHNYFNKAADGTTTVFTYSGANGTDTHINWTVEDGKVQTPNCVRDIQAMVDRDKNSPAIFLWSTGNEIYDSSDGHGMDTQWLLSAAVKEIDSLDNIPWRNVVDTSRKRTKRPEPEENHAALPSAENGNKTDYGVRGGGDTVDGGVESLDHGARYGRPISAAPPTWDTGDSKVTRKYGFIDNMAMADIGGHNYSRATNQYNTHKKRYPNASVAGTETVSAFYTRGVYNIEDYQGGNEEGGRWAHGSGYASEWPYNKNFTSASISIREHRDDMVPYMFGEMVWTGHDYLGEPTPHSSPSRSSYFGIIDTAGFEKDAFYMYRSAWTDIPTVHLLPQKWNWEMGTQVPIMVYTNAASVEVFINGKSIGAKKYDRDTAQPVYLDYGMQEYQAGELKAVAKDKEGNVIAEDVVYTAGAANSVVLSGEKAFIKNDGRDLLYVEATVADSAGIMVPTANNRITFHVEGGEIVALDNGDPRDREPFRGTNNHNNSNTSNSRKAFNGKALAIIRAKKGAEQIVVTAEADAGEGKIGSNTLTVGAVAQTGDGTNVQDYTLSEIVTGVGVTPILPETVGVVYDDGLIREYTIDSWKGMDAVNLEQPGSYEISAVSAGEEFETTLTVKEIESIEDVKVTTITGVEPPLPNFVTLHYKDGETGSAQVAWETADPALYAEENTFELTGKIGENKTITAKITVKEMIAIDDVTLDVERGVMPNMPSTVNVEFTDGTKEQLGVKWNISEEDVETAGKKKITGTVLGSEITAVAWLNVSMAVYASNLEYTVKTEGTVFKDTMSNKEPLQARGMQGGPGEVYEKGFGTKAPAEIEIDIAGKGYERFRSYANLSLVKGGVVAPGAVAFEVYLDEDETPAFSSGTMDRANEAALIDIDVTGKSKIRLVTIAKSDNAEDDLADWVNARFTSSHITVGEILTPQLYTADEGVSPKLPDTIEASVPGMEGSVAFGVKWLSSVSDSLFTSGSVQKVYGQIEGSAGQTVVFRYMTDYAKACRQEGFSGKIDSWSATETFDYEDVGKGEKSKFNRRKLTPKLLYSGSTNMLVENVGNYGFANGIYPDPASSDYVVFAAPNLSYFQVKNVANTTAISNNNSFTFETSTDGRTWTTFTDFTKEGILPKTGTDAVWAQRYYTSNEDAVFPAGTNYLRVNYPNGQTWKFNMTQIVLKGSGTEKADADMTGFTLGGYMGVIDQTAETVSVLVPSSLNVTSIEPEITVLPGASVSPKGAQDFTEPVTYTVTNGSVTKQYTVNVNKGVTVSFHPYGGTFGGSAEAVTELIAKGNSAAAPTVDPERDGYLFGGWTTDREGKEAMRPEEMSFDQDTVFYAIWNQDPRIVIQTDADATGKTWQNEKNTNYGTGNVLHMRQNNNTASYGSFGENFNNTSTSDGTDMKTAFIRFDVSGLKDKNIKTVKLALHYAGNENQGGTENNVKILATAVDTDWNENRMTWTTRPRIKSGAKVVESAAFTAEKSGSRTIELDVTDFYKSLEDGEDQIAFAVTVNKSNHDYKLASKESTNKANAPRLLAEAEVAQEYTVTYHLNGGEGTVPVQAALEAGAVFAAARGTGITGPEGRQFAGWNTKADGSGTAYGAGDKVVMPGENLTLYAVYKALTTKKDALRAAIERVKNYKEADYTVSSWRAVETALAEAQRLAEDENALQADVNWAAKELRDALASLERVDKTGLKAAIDRANARIEADYTPESWAAMQDKLKAARVVEANKNAVQTAVDDATYELSEAIRNLEEKTGANKNALNVVIGRTANKTEEDYTPESWAAMQTALAAAQELMENEEAEQAAVNAAARELRDKIAALVRIDGTKDATDKDGLEAAMDRVEDRIEAEYTEASWAALQETLTAVQAVFENGSASQAEVDNATYELSEALRALIRKKKVDKEALQVTINRAGEADEADYTQESWSVLQAALAEAQRIMDDENALQEDVNNASKAMRQALGGLVRIDRSGLKSAIDRAEARDEEDYAAAGWAALQEKLAEAKTVMEAADATQEELDMATYNLSQAIRDLEPDTNALKKTVAEAEKKNPADYTAEGYAAYQKALEQIKSLLAKENITLEEFDTAKKSLQTALANLEKAKKTVNIDTAKKIPARGELISIGNLQYRVTVSDVKNGTAALVKCLRTNKKIVIPATVGKDGFTFKVTEVDKQVFQNDKTIKEVIFGENIAKIGAKSFYKCTKLKKITFQGTKAPKAGSKAFSGIKKNAKVMVPKKVSKKELKKFKKTVKSAGKKIAVKKK